MAPTENDSTGSVAAPEPAAKTTAGGLRRRTILILGAGILILALGFGIPYLRHALSHESTDDAFLEGTIISISPRVGGTVDQVLVEENRWVSAGDPLVTLDPADFKARRDASAAALEAARAAAVEAAAQVKTTEAQAAAAASLRDQADAQLALAKASLAQARASLASDTAEHDRDAMDLKRIQEMAETGTITDQDLDHAVAAERMSAAQAAAAEKKIDTQKAVVRQAEAALSAAGENLKEARALIDARRAQESRARAEVDRAGAELTQAELQLSYTRIVSPADGHVTRKAVGPGAFVQTGQALMAIVRPEVWVTANYKETQLTRMRPGQPATVTIDAFPDVTFTGHVESIQHGTGARFSLLPPENATGNYIKVVQRVPVKIVLDPDERVQQYLLVPGLSAVPEVDITARGEPADTPKSTAGGADP